METTDFQAQSFRIAGMTCINCQNRIEKKLKSTAGIEDASVSYETGTATVTYNASAITLDEIKAAVESLGYQAAGKGKLQASQIVGAVFLIFALYMLLRMFSTSSLAAAFPIAQAGMGYGMVLIIGLVTSVHCIAMCGGINLSQTLKGNGERGGKSPPPLLPALLYNTGRLISYTAVGVIVGALGSVITVSGRFQGAILLIAGIFMLIMGINMLGLFPQLRRFIPRMPKIFAQKIDTLSSTPHSPLPTPLIIGFLNGFMPCGPLQAMQLYALSTGSPVRGGISMFLFCLGTIPLMFALGAASTILSGSKGQAFSRRVMQVGAVLVAAMGLTMFANGWNLTGFASPIEQAAVYMRPASLRNEGGAFMPVIQNGVQIVNSRLLPNQYPAIVVQQGIPVRWTINAPQGSINGCNNRFIIREYGIEHTFRNGDNVIEFMPTKTGRFSYSCWMGMIRSSITVVAEGESIASAAEPSTTPTPAGVEIATDAVAVAQSMGNYQIVEISLTDDGFEPAIMVMQRQMPTLWNINVDSLDPGNSQLILPAYYTVMDMAQGNNPMQIIPSDDFEFSTGDNVFYGYVKVVDDINKVDIVGLKAEVANFETLIYPEAYFETAMGGGGGCPCCSGAY
ncbi:MAG: sulfite exporter TauE/SafE family protein [Treponema sp.]|jgi:sulfite exporter TauE/SafE/copper chaperone CopZ|nr:sulfite exporter TauE/SafE family protein [Treponema sp.]